MENSRLRSQSTRRGSSLASPIGYAMTELPVSPQCIDSYIRIGLPGGGNRDPSGKSGVNCLDPLEIWDRKSATQRGISVHLIFEDIRVEIDIRMSESGYFSPYRPCPGHFHSSPTPDIRAPMPSLLTDFTRFTPESRFGIDRPPSSGEDLW